MSAKPSPPPLPPANPSSNARRERAWGLVILNQFAFPGAGTVLAGRKIGYAQLVLSVIGVVGMTVFLGFAMPHLGELLHAQSDPNDDPEKALEIARQWLPWGMLALVSVTSIGIAWIWALATSASVLKSATKASKPSAK